MEEKEGNSKIIEERENNIGRYCKLTKLRVRMLKRNHYKD
jgi:hypothetical protein